MNASNPVTPRAFACACAIVLAIADVDHAQAQTSTAQDDASEEYVEQEPTSVEQGHTELDESFAPRDHAQWVRDTRRQAFADTKWDIQLRSYYFERERFDDSIAEAWALGGSLGFKTGWFRERFAFGATGYTSQKAYGPADRDGTLLLKPGQDGYTVLGEAYGEFLLNTDTRLSIGRRRIDTPYINRNDVRMTPNTFQAVTLQGLYGGDDGRPEWRIGGGYFDGIKERNSDEFVSMSVDAGAPSDVERGVYALGANFTMGDFSIGAIDYYSDDIINIFYTEAGYAVVLGERLRLRLAAQYTDQGSTGDELLTGSDFSADQWGTRAELLYGGALFTAAYTSAGGDSNMRSPWSGHPGYTAVQVEDFNRAGEDAWMVRVGYTFPTIGGASMHALYVDGSDPDSPTEFARNEYDLNFQWTIPDGFLEGLMVRLRYAYVEQDDPNRSDQTDFRVMIFYDPPGF